MNQLEVDASNCCIPTSHPLCGLFVPLPSTTRGEPTILDGTGGRLNDGRAVLLYGSGRLVIVRELGKKISDNKTDIQNGATVEGSQNAQNSLIQGFVYRGHGATVTTAKFSPSGAYVASGDIRGCVRIWSYDNDEHLCKFNVSSVLTGPIRDVAWDADGKRICIVGESGGDAALILQWDTAIKSGDLGQHSRGRVMTCDLNHRRPFRCMTGGKDCATLFNGNTPFVRIIPSAEKNVESATGHSREVNGVRFSPDSVWVCSVGGDKVMRLYHGKEGHCVYERRTDTHDGAIYACAWSQDSQFILTSSSDGTAKLWSVQGNPDDVASISVECVHCWDVAEHELHSCRLEAPGSSASPTSSAVMSPSTLKSSHVPKGAMQCGCAFLWDQQPVVVGINGHLTLLPKPPCLGGSNGLLLGEQPMTLSGHPGNVSMMAVTGTSAYTGDIDGVLAHWDLTTGVCTRILPHKSQDEGILSANHLLFQVHHGAISSIVALASGLVMSVGWDDYLRISRISTPGRWQSTRHYKLKSQPNAMAAGKSLVVIVTIGGLVYTDTSRPSNVPASPARRPSSADERPLTLKEMQLSYQAECVAVASDDSLVVVGSSTGDLYFYDPSPKSTWMQIHVVQAAHFKAVTSLQFSHDNSTLASADVRDVCVWNVSDAHHLASKEQHNNNVVPIISKNRWCFHTQRITALAWLNDSILASAGQDDQVYIWSLQKKLKRINYNYVHRGGVVGLAFVNNKLVSAGKDGCICQWNVKDDIKAKFGVTLD